jgi:hypothetical protein
MVSAGATFLIVTVASAVIAPPVVAVCGRLMGDPLFDPAAPRQVVFVGTAVEIGQSNQDALFHVEEVWYGRRVTEWESVFSQPGGGGFWSDSPTFEEGRKYLVVARHHRSELISATCGSTQEFTDEIRALRPQVVSAPAAAPQPESWQGAASEIPASLLFIGSLVTVVIVLSGVLFLLRRPSAGRRPSSA